MATTIITTGATPALCLRCGYSLCSLICAAVCALDNSDLLCHVAAAAAAVAAAPSACEALVLAMMLYLLLLLLW